MASGETGRHLIFVIPLSCNIAMSQVYERDEAKDLSHPGTGSPAARAADQKDLHATGSCDNQPDQNGDKDELESSEGKLESIHGESQGEVG